MSMFRLVAFLGLFILLAPGVSCFRPRPKAPSHCETVFRAPQNDLSQRSADTTQTIADFFELSTTCPQHPSKLIVDVFRLNSAPSDHRSVCRQQDAIPGSQRISIDSVASSGIYCLQIYDGVRLKDARTLILVSGNLSEVREQVLALSTNSTETDLLAKWLENALLISQESNQLRVTVADPTTAVYAASAELERQRRMAEEKPSYVINFFRPLIRYRFCCGRTQLDDAPVANYNEAVSRWFKGLKLKGELRLVGYASSKGECKANEKLAQRRAETTAAALRKLGHGKTSAEWCGETGPANQPLPIDESSYWQRVDIHLPPELTTVSIVKILPNERSTALAPGTKVSIAGPESTLCSVTVAEYKVTQVDVVVVVDTSGSMADDWRSYVTPQLAADASTLLEQLSALGIDANVHVYTLDANLCGTLAATEGVTCSALMGKQLPTCNGTEANESWGTATSWLAQNHHWRPRALRAIVPISDELPCEGDHSSTFSEDVSALEGAISESIRYGVIVFPFFGTLAGPRGSSTVTSLMARLGYATGGSSGDLYSAESSPFEMVARAIRHAARHTRNATLLDCSPVSPSTQVTIRLTPPNGTQTLEFTGMAADFGLTAAPQRGVDCRTRQACPEDDTALRPVVSDKEPRLECL